MNPSRFHGDNLFRIPEKILLFGNHLHCRSWAYFVDYFNSLYGFRSQQNTLVLSHHLLVFFGLLSLEIVLFDVKMLNSLATLVQERALIMSLMACWYYIYLYFERVAFLAYW